MRQHAKHMMRWLKNGCVILLLNQNIMHWKKNTHPFFTHRKHAGLTQEEVAKRMGTKAPAIARLEATSSRDKHSPGISTLRKYAHAVGCELEIHLKPFSRKKKA